MKKLKLNALFLQNEEVLSRAQLKRVLGGDDGSGADATEAAPKIEACKKLKEGDACAWVYKGEKSSGYCRRYAFGTVLHCSNLI